MRIGAVAKIAVISTLLISISAAAADRQKKNDEATRFVSRVSLVLIPTVVSDHSGQHVSGLKKQDFVVLEDGRPQDIALFEEIETRPGVFHRVSAGQDSFTNIVPAEARPQRLTLIVLDMLNTRFEDQVRARRDLLKFISETLQPGDPHQLLRPRQTR